MYGAGGRVVSTGEMMGGESARLEWVEVGEAVEELERG